MRRSLQLLFLLLLFCAALFAQTGRQITYFTASGSSAGVHPAGSINSHQLIWTTISGTWSACTLTLDSSTDGVTWTAGGVITAQTCTSDSTSAIVSATPQWVRVTATVTIGTGTPTLRAVWNGTSTSAGAVTGTGTANTVTKWTGTSTQGNSSVTDDGTNPVRSPNGLNVAASGYNVEYPNAGVSGTTLNATVCNNGSNQGVVCLHGTSTTNQPLGFVVAGAGTTGSATVCVLGFCKVVFDNQSVIGDYAINSSTLNGELHDNGTTLTAGQPNYYVQTANSGAGTIAQVRLLTADDFTSTSLTGYVKTIASGATALGTSAIASGACATVVTATATGVLTTDNVIGDFNADPTSTVGFQPSTSGMLTIIKYPTANNVNFKVCNNTASSVTPGAVTLNWRVLR